MGSGSSQGRIGNADLPAVPGQRTDSQSRNGMSTNLDTPGSTESICKSPATQGHVSLETESDDTSGLDKSNFVQFRPRDNFTSMEDLETYLKDCVKFLDKTNEYGGDDVYNLLQSLFRISCNSSSREEIGDSLANFGYSAIVKKMTEHFDAKGNFSGTNFRNLTSMQGGIWNYIDMSKNLAKAFWEAGLIPCYLQKISSEFRRKNGSTDEVTEVQEASLNILNNILRLCPECKETFVKENAYEDIKLYLEDEDVSSRMTAIMMVLALIDEREAAKLKDNNSIEFTIEYLESVLDNDAESYIALELTEGLSRMAVNDSFKKKIVDGGALRSLVRIMNERPDEEKGFAIKTIWTLCFDEYSRDKVQNEEGCVEALEKLAKSENDSLKHKAEGALWELRGKANHQQKEHDDGATQNSHIFLSYNHDHSEVVCKIKDQLKKDGYRVWIDSEQMGGSTLEAMAEAVENASVVLVCVSEKYKLSPNCRSEAEYTFQLKRPVVPLLMQRRYKADGWLGMLLGSKLWVDFNGKYEFGQAYKLLIKQMTPHLSTDKTIVATKQVVAAGKPDQQEFDSHVMPYASHNGVSLERHYETITWRQQDVANWLTQSGLDRVLNKKLKKLLDEMDGPTLVEFAELKYTASEFFCAHLERKYNADMMQLLRLSQALKKLP